MNNFIQNASKFDVITGRHADAGENSMLIQIVDFFDTFPTPKCNFKEVLQFKFDDVLDGPTACTDLQAQELADLVESLSDKVENLESIARYQENQINTIQEEVLRLNGIVDTW